jgi:transposase
MSPRPTPVPNPSGTPPGTREEMEEQRLRGALLLLKGVRQAEVARQCGVARQSVTRWNKRLKTDTLRLRKATGRNEKLSMAQCEEVYRTRASKDWTGEKFAAAILKRFKVKWHRDHAGRKLRVLREEDCRE